MEISKQELEQLPLLSLENTTHNNGGMIYLKDKDTSYKIFRDFYSYQDEVERNIDFQIDNKIPNIPQVYDKIYVDGKFLGYSMQYERGTLTFRNAIGRDISFNDKISAICDIYQSLRYLHEKGIYLGDIHSDNFLISVSGEGYLIDLENMRFPGDEFKFQQCYLIKPNNGSNEINIASDYTDNAKVMISSLSLLLDRDLEKVISKHSSDINLQEIYEKVILPLNNEKLSDYFEKIIIGKVEYFDEFLKRKYSISKSKVYF